MIPANTDGTEPLVRASDLDAYRDGLARFRAGTWDEGQWASVRLRHGVYGQRQSNRQMVRVKVPGGVVPLPWLAVLAGLARDFSDGTVHLTTRQDFQLYGVALDQTPDLLARLEKNGLTTREAGGNTVRNITACALAGACPRQRVDAGRVAEELARAWLRHPLVQSMPRKLKVTVSGCATDCGHATIHDLGLIAVEKNGRPGFRVLVGGGLGAQPMAGLEIADFLDESEVPVALEAAIRLHVRHSSRQQRARARLKFTIRRLGTDAFIAAFRDEMADLTGLPRRPWPPLAWRQPSETGDDRPPYGLIASPDGSIAAILRVPLGQISAEQLDGVSDLASALGASEARLTRDQNIVLLGLPHDRAAEAAARIAALGLTPPPSGPRPGDVVTCPGITTCRIGITNARALGQILEDGARLSPGSPSIHVSGCHNSCGLHHVADIGLHGLSRIIDGRLAPHYRIHLGGDARRGQFGIDGPSVLARQADRAVAALTAALASDRHPGESIRDWAERIGPDGVAKVLEPLATATDRDLFVDWGETEPFAGPPRASGECAAPQLGSAHLGDLAVDALANLDRFLAVGRWPEALKAGETATVLAIRRLLGGHGLTIAEEEETETVFARFRASPAARGNALDAFDSVLAERISALVTGNASSYRTAVAGLVETATGSADRPS